MSIHFNQNKVIAHKGAWKASNIPENSIASLKEAISLGCEGSEFDVWMTADGVLVVNHDPDFLGLPIENAIYEDLQLRKLPNGESIPTVKSFLMEGMKQSSTRLILEIKSSDAHKIRKSKLVERILQLEKYFGAEKWLEYISFDVDVCKKLIALAPHSKVSYLNGDLTPSELAENGFYGLDYELEVLKSNPQWIKEANNLGLKVNVWTVDEKNEMLWLLEKGVDCITTNEPELLLGIMGNERFY